jgi:transcriptional regulator with XRE-family HTH domain
MFKGEKTHIQEADGVSEFSSDESELDYQILSQEIVRYLRGKINQRVFSKKLGYSFNQVGKWESGVTQIKWHDFLILADFLKLPIEKSFRMLFSSATEKFNYKNSLTILDRHLVLRSNVDYPEHKHVIKWIKGTSQPHFASILQALDTRPSMLMGWLSYFADCRQVPCLLEKQDLFMARIEAVLKDPNCVYVNSALHLRPYYELKEHDENLLAQHAACTIDQLRKTLKSMLDAKIIRFDGKKYLPCPFDFSFSALPLAKLRPLTKYTTQLAADAYPSVPVQIDTDITKTLSLSSVRVVAMSPSASRRVGDLITQFHNQMAEIVKEDHLPKENVQILILHSFASNLAAKRK